MILHSAMLPPLSGHGELQTEHAESAAELSTILDGFNDLMITYADQRIGDDPVWAQMKAQRTAMMMIL